jgi:hypothetical protein
MTESKKTHATGLLVAESLEHWCPVLEKVGKLDARAFSTSRGAADAASGRDFPAAGTEDDARDRAFELLDELSTAAGTGAARMEKIPAEGSEGLVTEFRRVAEALSGQEASVRNLMARIVEQSADAAGAAVLSPPTGAAAAGAAAAALAPLPPPTPPKTVAELQHEAYSFQNNGAQMAEAVRPPDAMVESIAAKLGGGAAMSLGDLADLTPGLQADGLQRHEVTAFFEQALNGAVLATASEIGLRHLHRMFVTPTADTISAIGSTGAAATIGGKQSTADELKAAMRATLNQRGVRVTTSMARAHVLRVWRTLDASVRLGNSLNVACTSALVAAQDPPLPDANDRPPRPRGGRSSRGSGGGGSSRTPRARSRSPSSGSESDAARRHRRRRHRSRSSSGSDSGSSPARSSTKKGKYDDRDKWGGAKYSQYACHAEMSKKGSCTRKMCQYSHDPEKCKAARDKKEKEEKKDKDKRSKKHRK